MARKPSRPYTSLHDWMERTNVNQTELRQLLADRCGVVVSSPHMSGILTGRWRCSLPKAEALTRITGVPVEKLFARAKVSRPKDSDAAA